MYKTVTKCRACGGTDLPKVFDLGNQPLANNHCKSEEARQGFYPLSILFCISCGLAQLSAVVDKHVLYDKYTYVTSDSETMRRHFDRLFKDIESEGVTKRLLEVGSNDGKLLGFAKERGFEVLGVDPAKNLAAIANSHGLPTIPEFFNRDVLSREILSGVILARHCFAHIDDWYEFFETAAMVSNDQTLLCLEVPYVGDMLTRTEFDTVYHEHLSYISIKPVAMCASASGWRIHRVIKYGIHGGAILIMFSRIASDKQPHLSADECLADENITIEVWNQFYKRAKEKIENLSKIVEQLKSDHKIFSCFGASAKSTVMVNACGFDEHDVAFCTDNSPFKPGKLIPGTNIPIIEEDEMLSHHPDYAICGAWNYKAEITQKMAKYLKRGGHFIFPTPHGWEIA